MIRHASLCKRTIPCLLLLTIVNTFAAKADELPRQSSAIASPRVSRTSNTAGPTGAPLRSPRLGPAANEETIADFEDYGDAEDDNYTLGSNAPPANDRRFYFRAEYLSWWLSGDELPPLITTSSESTPRGEAGVLGESNTVTLFGGETVNDQMRSGARIVLGMALTPYTAIEGEWFGFGNQGATFNQFSNGSEILARPFFNLSTGAEDAYVIAYPEQATGTVTASLKSELLGAGLQFVRKLAYRQSEDGLAFQRLDLIYGFRYLGLNERLQVDDATTTTDESGSVPVGTVFSTSDQFSTSNDFYGGNFGVLMESHRGRWHVAGAAKIAVGGTSERVVVSGNSSVSDPDEDAQNFNGGLLALPTNIGQYSQNVFTLVPQVQLRLALDLTPQFRWNVGYDLLYWSFLVRPGNQVDLLVNPTQASGQLLDGTPGPLFPFAQTDLWIQGINTGLEFKF
jgi:hypothetical protein